MPRKNCHKSTTLRFTGFAYSKVIFHGLSEPVKRLFHYSSQLISIVFPWMDFSDSLHFPRFHLLGKNLIQKKGIMFFAQKKPAHFQLFSWNIRPLRDGSHSNMLRTKITSKLHSNSRDLFTPLIASKYFLSQEIKKNLTTTGWFC